MGVTGMGAAGAQVVTKRRTWTWTLSGTVGLVVKWMSCVTELEAAELTTGTLEPHPGACGSGAH